MTEWALVSIFLNGEPVHQLQFKIDSRCSNNQAEQVAMLKALQKVEELQLTENTPKALALYADSKITLDSLRNTRNHHRLIEDIRKAVNFLRSKDWIVTISWVKAHIGIYGNELADLLAKEAVKSNNTVWYDKIPRSSVMKTLRTQEY